MKENNNLKEAFQTPSPRFILARGNNTDISEMTIV